MMLQPPPPHVLELFVEAAENKSLADELIENFNVPVVQPHSWRGIHLLNFIGFAPASRVTPEKKSEALASDVNNGVEVEDFKP